MLLDMNRWGRALATMVVLMAAVAAEAASPASQPGARPTDDRLMYPTFGVELPEPRGWRHVFEDEVHVVAYWVPVALPDDTHSIIEVSMSPTKQTARAEAEDAASRWKTTIEQTTLDSEPAYRVRMPRNPYIVIWCEKYHQLYTVEYAREQHFDPQELEQFRQGWRWHGMESPARYATLDPAYQIRVDNRFLIRFPAWMRLSQIRPSGQPAPRGVVLLAPDHAGAEHEVAMSVTIETTDSAGLSLARSSQRLGEAIQKANRLGRPIAFRAVGEKGDRVISEPVKPANGDLTMMLIALVAPDAKTIVQISFYSSSRDEAKLRIYAELAGKIVASLQDLQAAASGK